MQLNEDTMSYKIVLPEVGVTATLDESFRENKK
jgi:hypothetical protein